jgi:molybdate transport system ATP-binding protein
MIRVSVSKTLREFSVAVDFTVSEGQCLVLVGPTGCGKTTTLRLIAGLADADEGSIELDGEFLLDTKRRLSLPPQRRHVGVVFQDYALFPHLSVLRNVTYGAAARGIPRAQAEALAREALERVQLPGLEQVKPTQLSGGQQQRVALARALASGARMLLMDEPMSALDPHTRRQVRSELRALISDVGLQTICVTHDVADALTLGDVIGVMKQGRIVQLGDRRELLSQPRDAFVAEFLGINLLSGLAQRQEEGLTAVTVGPHTFYSLSELSGEVMMTFHPSDVSLSLTPPESSAMNVFRGKVSSLSHLGGRTRVTVEDGISIIVELTHSSEERLGLELGTEVYASFKASALQVYT